MRSAAGSKKGRSSVAPRRVLSSSRVARPAAVRTYAESQVSKGSISNNGVEEEDEKYGLPSQDRDILGKRAWVMAEVSYAGKLSSITYSY